MSGLEIGLMWALIAVVIITMVLFCIFMVGWGQRKREVEELNKNLKVVEKTRDSLWDEKCDMNKKFREQSSYISDHQHSLRIKCEELKAATDQLKQIKDLREMGKKKIVVVDVKDGEDAYFEKVYEADDFVYSLNDQAYDIYRGEACIASIPRENTKDIEIKLVDIDSAEKEK